MRIFLLSTMRHLGIDFEKFLVSKSLTSLYCMVSNYIVNLLFLILKIVWLRTRNPLLILKLNFDFRIFVTQLTLIYFRVFKRERVM